MYVKIWGQKGGKNCTAFEEHCRRLPGSSVASALGLLRHVTTLQHCLVSRIIAALQPCLWLEALLLSCTSLLPMQVTLR